MKFENKRPHKRLGSASARSTSAKMTMCPAPVGDLVQVRKFWFDQSVQVLYNYCIDERETNMTTADFFADFHSEHYSEFVDAELREMFQDTTPVDGNFDLDVPFW